MVTQQEARDMWTAIEQFQAADAAVVQAQTDALKQTAKDWWDTIKPAEPTTRIEALASYHLIEGLLQTETDQFRLTLLQQKLRLANEEFQERKRNG